MKDDARTTTYRAMYIIIYPLYTAPQKKKGTNYSLRTTHPFVLLAGARTRVLEAAPLFPYFYVMSEPHRGFDDDVS